MDRRVLQMSIALPLLMIGSFVLGFFAREAAPKPDRTLLSKVAEVSSKIQERYPVDVPREKLERSTVDGLLLALDPACEYFSAEEWKDYHERHMEGKFGGVGVLIEQDLETGYLKVTTPIEDTPAFAADVLPNDLIVAVDGADIKGLALNDVIKKIKGELGTKVTLTLYRKGRDRFKVELVRAQIEVKAVKHKIIENEIGYIRISDFTNMMPQFDAATDELLSKNIKALVIDLRFNGGGLLSAAVDLCDRFVPEGSMLVQTKGKKKLDNKSFVGTSCKKIPNIPLVVLVNEGTASASEIFSGAMHDLKRGTMVGSRTYGKGTMQTPFDLSDGSYLKITTAHWFTPAGINVNKQPGVKDYGLEPEYLVEMSPQEEGEVMRRWNEERPIKGQAPPELKPVNDYQLAAGLEILHAKMAGREPKVDRRELTQLKPKTQPH